MSSANLAHEDAFLSQGDINVVLVDENDTYLKAFFSRAGRRLPQHPLMQQCYVMVEPGMFFSLQIAFDGRKVPYRGGALVVSVFFDGIRVSDAFITAESIEKRAKEIRTNAAIDLVYGATQISGSPGDEGVMRCFYMGVRNVIAEGEHWKHRESLGQIRVDVCWASLSTGLPGSMKHMYPDLGALCSPTGAADLRGKHRLIASLGAEMVDEDIQAERESEGGFRFEHEPLDDDVHVFIFHYGEHRELHLRRVLATPRKWA